MTSVTPLEGSIKTNELWMWNMGTERKQTDSFTVISVFEPYFSVSSWAVYHTYTE